MDLLDELLYHRDTLAALKSYGNGHGHRAAQARDALARAIAAIPDTANELAAAAEAHRAAGRPGEAETVEQRIAAMKEFLPSPAPPVAPVTPAQSRRTSAPKG